MSKLIVLAPSAGGKSTLMRYLREHSDFNVMEMDEEVLKENGNKWPEDNNYKDEVLVPKIADKVLDKDKVIYLASYVSEEQLIKARSKSFKVVLLDVSVEELSRRNKKRMNAEDYADVSPWLQLQLNTFAKLKNKGLIDKVIDGHSSSQDIAMAISKYIAV